MLHHNTQCYGTSSITNSQKLVPLNCEKNKNKRVHSASVVECTRLFVSHQSKAVRFANFVLIGDGLPCHKQKSRMASQPVFCLHLLFFSPIIFRNRSRPKFWSATMALITFWVLAVLAKRFMKSFSTFCCLVRIWSVSLNMRWQSRSEADRQAALPKARSMRRCCSCILAFISKNKGKNAFASCGVNLASRVM